MLCSELSKSALTISKVEKLLEKATTRVKQEIANSRALNLQNESFKELSVKLGVNPNDKAVLDAVIQSS